MTSQTPKPAVSVLMTVFNGARFVAEAVNSILCQTLQDFELILVDDGSTDATPRILAELASLDSRIKVVYQANGGCGSASNLAFKYALGAYIARLDADDVALPQRLEMQVGFLETHPQIVAVGTNVLFLDDDGWEIGYGEPLLTHQEIEEKDLFHGGCGIIHPTMMARYEAVRMVGGYRPGFKYALDLDLFLRLGEVGGLSNIPSVLVKCRKSLGGISLSRRQEQMVFVQQAVNETWARRRLSGNPPQLLPSNANAKGLGQHHRDFSLMAINSKFYGSALKHAALSVVTDVRSTSSWRTLLRALLGPLILPCRCFRESIRIGFLSQTQDRPNRT